MTVSVSRGTILDLAALSGARTVLQWRTAKVMFEAGEIYAVRAADRLICLGYYFPIGPGQAEAGFNPSLVDDAERGLGKAAPHMLGIARAMRLTLESSAYSAIVTEIGSAAGARIARAIGFHPSGVSGSAGEIWAYGHADRRKRQAAAAADQNAGRADRRQPAPVAGADGSPAG